MADPVKDQILRNSGETAPVRGIFLHSDGATFKGLQISGDLTKLEIYALLQIALKRVEAELHIDKL